MEIAVVPADDAHGVDSVGVCIDDGIVILQGLGVKPPWRKPVST
jgi:hypothetical protein